MATGNRICEWLYLTSILGNGAHLGRYSLNSELGTEDDLKALVDALHARDMYLMVDVVANHMVGAMVHDCRHWLIDDYRDPTARPILSTIAPSTRSTRKTTSTLRAPLMTTTTKLRSKSAG